ncbi:MAG TPA: tetratricopeptide repeat protein [Chthonomonadaceae bacterium]|nr:tetratricopeptide repeat protein [Chthonomonadaceae bacterium]
MKRRTTTFVCVCTALVGAAYLTRQLSVAEPQVRAAAHFDEANRLTREGDWPGAGEEFRQAIEAEPGFFEAREGLSYLYQNMQRLPEAITVLKEGMQLMPADRARYCSALSDLYAIEKDYAQAIAWMRQSLQAAPDNRWGRQELAMLCERARQWKEAEAAWNEFLARYPGDGMGVRGLVRARREQAVVKSKSGTPLADRPSPSVRLPRPARTAAQSQSDGAR